MNLTESELILRLQNLQCCIGTLSNQLLNNIKIGATNVDCKLQELQVLERFFKYLKCYKIEDTLSAGAINITYFNKGSGLLITVGETNISSGATVGANNANEFSTILVDDINSFQTVYVATLDTSGELYTISISGPCDAGELGILMIGLGPVEYTFSGMTGGVCSSDINCLTEDEVMSMLDYSATKCKQCFELSI